MASPGGGGGASAPSAGAGDSPGAADAAGSGGGMEFAPIGPAPPTSAPGVAPPPPGTQRPTPSFARPRAAEPAPPVWDFDGSAPARAGGASPPLSGGATARSLKGLGKSELNAHLRLLEDELRNKLWAMADFNGGEVRLLLRAFRRVDVEWPQGCVARAEFVQALALVGVTCSTAEAALFFKKYGMDRDGLLPYEAFCRAVLASGGKAPGADNIKEGPYRPGDTVDPDARVRYRPARKDAITVYPPADFDADMARRSMTLPDRGLKLDFVHGYGGLTNTAPNLFYTDIPTEVVYYTAAVGIVYDKRTHTQKFFKGHNDDIKCLAVHPDHRNVVCTGQVTPIGTAPYACIWDTHTARPVEGVPRLWHGRDDRAVIACCFSSGKANGGDGGRRLVTVVGDNEHSVYVWKWMSDTPTAICKVKNHQGTPPEVYGVMWHPFKKNAFLTWGCKHLKMWTPATHDDAGKPLSVHARGKVWKAEKMHFKRVQPHNVLSVAVLPSMRIVTGSPEGWLYIWEDGQLVGGPLKVHEPPKPKKRVADGAAPPPGEDTVHDALDAARNNPVYTRPVPAGAAKGAVAAAQKKKKAVPEEPSKVRDRKGVFCLKLRADGRTLLSAGADGRVLAWDVSSGDLRAGFSVRAEVRSPYDAKARPVFKSLDCHPNGGDVFVAGTRACDIWEIDSDPEVLIYGHTSDLYGCAFNPVSPTQYITACDSSKVFLWDAAERWLCKVFDVGGAARAGAFSPDGAHLAVGLADGRIKVIDIKRGEAAAPYMNFAAEQIAVLKYSPDGSLLAAGSNDNFVDVYAVHNGYRRISRCKGHSSFIKHLDWDSSSRIIQCTSASYELLYFEALTGQQAYEGLRDLTWVTWTCTLGFPVMGIFPPGADGTDVNACSRSYTRGNAGGVIATADDFGGIKMLNYPCCIEDAPFFEYTGHSSHVTDVRFSVDDQYLVSTGGHDRAVFQWRVVDIPKAPAARRPAKVTTVSIAKRGEGDMSVDDADRKPFSLGGNAGRATGGGATSWQAQQAAAMQAGKPGPGMCRYKVTVKTSDIRGASTSANVFLLLHGTHGAMKHARMLDAGRTCFERGNEDMFLFDAVDVGPMQKCTVHHDDTGFSPSWHLDNISVVNATTGERAVFACEQWFDRSHGDRKIKRTLVAGGAGRAGKMVEYRITLATADVRGAGTDAGVRVVLEGTKGARTPELLLESAKDNFERGKLDVFKVRALDVGALKSLIVGIDMKGASPEWCLASAEVASNAPDFARTVFPCGTGLWFDHAYPKRTLTPGSGKMSVSGAGRPCEWVVTVVTADERFAGTDANVYLRIEGAKGETPTMPLEATRADFERGNVDVFKLTAPDVGEIVAVVIGHDGRGMGSGWKCASVEVVNTTTNTRAFFACGSWFDVSQGDGLTERRLLASASGASALQHSYSIRVLTSDDRFSGTDADVFVEIEGTKAKSERLQLNNSKNNFERAMLDEFQFTLPDLGTLKRILLGHNNKGVASGWKPDYVEIDDNNTGVTVFFPCKGLWWAKDEGDKQIERYLEPADASDPLHTYAVTVVTSDIKGAGTDADVTLSFSGSKGNSGDHRLDNSRNNFERGMVDAFQIKSLDVGTITSCCIGHNNRGFGAGWHMQSLTITDTNTGVETIFVCDMWFAKDEGDGEIVRTLVPTGAAAAKVKYKIQVVTSDLRGAGTDASVYMYLNGDLGKSAKLAVDSSANDHERNTTCTVFKELPELGEISSIVLGHGNEGLGPSWHCESVVVTNGTTNKSWYFPVDMWFSKKDGDGKIERTILSGSAQAARSGKATYKVTVYTADCRGAGTDANVFIQLFGEAADGSGKEASTDRIKLDDSANNFERAAVDEFQIKTVALDPISKIRLGSDNAGLGSAWKVDTVEVVNMGTGRKYFYNVDAWFSKKDGLEKDLVATDPANVGKKHKYRVVVHTSDLRGAGTDANVFATIFGAGKDSGRLVLDNSKDNFERNQVDTFFFELPYSLGELEYVRIGHDNFGIGAAWHCNRVEVTELSTNKMVTFPCGRWFSKSEGDRQIEADLWPEGSAKAGMVQRMSSKYKIEVTTADERGAGTDANVWIELHGEELSSRREPLDTSKNDFERGNKDTFFIECTDLGKLDHVLVGTDGTGFGSSWKLAYIEVTNVQTNERYFFPCDAWFDKKNGLEKKLQPDSPDSMGGTRRLKVVVHTSDIRGAGTDANVSIVMFDALGNRSSEHKLDNSKDNFERGMVDEFMIVDQALKGEITKINIGHDGAGFGAGWHLQQVEITDVASGHTYFFPSGKWFDKGVEPKLLRQDIELGDPTAGVETGLAKYKVVVHTTDRRGAGTDANVFLVLFGKDKQSGRRSLDTSADNFERGAVDTFFFEDIAVGPLERIQIGHDNSRPFPGWHCAQVEVTNVSSGETTTFPCDQWFDRKQGDKKVERVLFPRDASGAVVGVKTAKYRVEVHTADVRGAGTDANVFMELSGTEGDTAEIRLTNASGKDLFERGKTDEFLIEEKDVGAAKKLTVWHDGAWFGSDWMLRGVDVTNGATSEVFNFSAPDPVKGVLVKKNVRVELLAAGAVSDTSTQPPTRYKVTVKTSNKRGSGTDANVFVRLSGQHGDSGAIQLPTEKGDLERGETNAFEVSAPAVGVLDKLEVWHDNSGMFGAAWRLDWVEVEDMGTGVSTKFRVYRWLDKKQGLKAEVYSNSPSNVTPASTPSTTPSATPRPAASKPMIEDGPDARPATAPASVTPVHARGADTPDAEDISNVEGADSEAKRTARKLLMPEDAVRSDTEDAGGGIDAGSDAEGGGGASTTRPRRCKPCRSKEDVRHVSPATADGKETRSASDTTPSKASASQMPVRTHTAAENSFMAPSVPQLDLGRISPRAAERQVAAAVPSQSVAAHAQATVAAPTEGASSAAEAAAPAQLMPSLPPPSAPTAAPAQLMPSLPPPSAPVVANARAASQAVAAPVSLRPSQLQDSRPPYDPRDPYAVPTTAQDAEEAAEEAARLSAALRREAEHKALADLEAREARMSVQQAALEEQAAAFADAMAVQREQLALQQQQVEQQRLEAAAAIQQVQMQATALQQYHQQAISQQAQAAAYAGGAPGQETLAPLDSFNPYAVAGAGGQQQGGLYTRNY